MQTFQTGKTYTAKSICNADCTFSFKVKSRTAKFLTLVDGLGKTRRVGVTVSDGREMAAPLGRYSMSPRIWA